MARLSGVIAWGIVAISAPCALACNVPGIAVSTSVAGPGDSVNFSITGTEPGATYTVYANGQDVASDTDPDGGGVADRFAMPDLGDADLPVTVELRVIHPDPGGEGDEYHGGAPWWGNTADVTYRAPVAGQVRSERATPVPGKARSGRPGPTGAKRAAAGRRTARGREARRARGRSRSRRRRARRGRRAAAARGRSAARRRRARAAAKEASAPDPPQVVRQAAERTTLPKSSAGKVGMKGAVGLLMALTTASAIYGRWRGRRA